MASFRLLNNFPVYLDNQGRPADDGYLLFFEAGTSTPKDVFADPGLTISNGDRVDLLSSGRTAVDVWGSGSYRVRLYDGANQLLAEADDVEIAGGDGATIPALVDGYYLTNNGSLLLWAPILEVPDPTGQNGKVLTSDGTGVPVWVAPAVAPEPPDPEIVVTNPTAASVGFRAGVSTDSTKVLLQAGIDVAPANPSGTTTNKAISFPQPFQAGTQPAVFAFPRTTQPGGPNVGYSSGDATSVGATIVFDVAEGTNQNNKVVNEVHFYWFAIGTIEVAP